MSENSSASSSVRSGSSSGSVSSSTASRSNSTSSSVGSSSGDDSHRSSQSSVDGSEADSLFPRNSPIVNTMGYAKLHSACKATIDYLVRKRDIIIGRCGFDADCQIRSDTRVISRHHARLFWDEERDKWAIECISQRNGVLVDGAPLIYGSPPLHLRSKALVEMGDVAFFFLLPTESTYRTPDIATTEDLVLELRTARKRKRAGSGATGGGGSRKRKKPPLMPPIPAKRKANSRKKSQPKQSPAADVETDDSSRNSEDEIEEQTLEIDEDEIPTAPKPEPAMSAHKDASSRSSRASPALDEAPSEATSPLPNFTPPEGSTKQQKAKKEPKTASGKKRKKDSPSASRDGLGILGAQFREEWFKKEKADFFRALNAVGTDPIRDEAGDIIGFDWTRFRRIAELPKKSDAQLRSYYHAVMKDATALLEEEDREKRTKGPRTKHKPGCECVVCKNTRKSRRKKREENNENNTAEEPPVVEQNEEDAVTETKNTGRAGDRLIGLVTAQKLRVRFNIHDALRQVDSPAGIAIIDKFGAQGIKSTELPDWWDPGRHDRALLLLARKHGVGMWNDIWKDDECEDFMLVKEDHGEDVEWPSPQVAMKRLREVVSAINAEIRRLNKKEAKRAERAEKGKKSTKGRSVKREGKSEKSKAKKDTGTIAKLKASLAKKRKAEVEAVVEDNENNNAEDVATQSEGSRSKGSSRADSELEIEIDEDEDEMVIEEEYDDDALPVEHEAANQAVEDGYAGQGGEEQGPGKEYETSSETGYESGCLSG